MPPKRKKITIREVARYASVSTATISNILNGRSSRCTPEVEERVRQAMKDLDFEPDFNARSLSRGSNSLLGLVLQLTSRDGLSSTLFRDNPFYPEFFDGANHAARSSRYDIIVAGVSKADDSAAWARNKKADGLLFIGAGPDPQMAPRLGKAVVVVDAACPSPYPWPQVKTDDIAAARDATAALIALGHTDFAFISGQKWPGAVHQNRYDGFRFALEEAGMDPSAALVREGHCSYEGGLEAGAALAAEGRVPGAIFCPADIMAYGLVRSLQRSGLRVPEDVSVMGFDGISPPFPFEPALSTVSQGIYAKGELAATLLIGILEGRVTADGAIHYLPHQVLLRDSTSARYL